MTIKTVGQLQQCSFCRHDVPADQCVCLTCGAQKSPAMTVWAMLLCYVAIIASVIGTGFAVYCSPFGGGLLAALPMAIGAPKWVALTAFVVGSLATFGVLTFVVWKLFVGSWAKVLNRDSVWIRGGAALPMRPMV